jgi:hypothetical protein
MARLLSVNVGLPRDVSWQGERVFTSVWKQAVQLAVPQDADFYLCGPTEFLESLTSALVAWGVSSHRRKRVDLLLAAARRHRDRPLKAQAEDGHRS